jgi:hypothetical protein
MMAILGWGWIGAYSALNDLEQLASVVEFKMRFYPSAWSRYQAAIPGSLKLIPRAHTFNDLKEDYIKMRNMIFGQHPNSDEMMEELQQLENEINSL